MTNRKENNVNEFIKLIDNSWQLSIEEFEVLESVLLAFCGRKITEIKKIEHLINDETDDLLALLDSKEIEKFAEDTLNMINADNCEECDDCVDLYDYDDGDLLDECDRRELKVSSNFDIETQSNLYEIKDLFLAADFNRRQEILKYLKQ